VSDGDTDLRAVLETLHPKARDTLRRVLIRDQANRDAIASQLPRYRDGHGDDWVDIIDFLTMHPDARRQVARVIAKIDADRRSRHGRRRIPAKNLH
jgi:hypothetical protein